MIRTSDLEVALKNAKVGDRLRMCSSFNPFVEVGVIVINNKMEYNVWVEKDSDFGDSNWYDDLSEMIRDYWETWNLADGIEIELY